MFQRLKPYFRDTTIRFALIGMPLLAVFGVFGLSLSAEKAVAQSFALGVILVITAAFRISKANRKPSAEHLNRQA